MYFLSSDEFFFRPSNLILTIVLSNQNNIEINFHQNFLCKIVPLHVIPVHICNSDYFIRIYTGNFTNFLFFFELLLYL